MLQTDGSGMEIAMVDAKKIEFEFKKYMDMKRKYKRYVLVAEGFYTDEEVCNAAMVNFMITYDDGVKSLEEDL